MLLTASASLAALGDLQGGLQILAPALEAREGWLRAGAAVFRDSCPDVLVMCLCTYGNPL